MTFLDYISLLPAMISVWLAMDIVVFGIKKAVAFFKVIAK